MPKTTIAEACRKRGLTRGEWDEAKRQGIDPWDQKAMAEWLAGRRHRIKPGAQISDTEAADAQTLEQIEDAIRKATDIDTVKILKEKVMALKTAMHIRTESCELIPVGEVRQSITRVVSAARGEFLKMTADIPPRAEGLDAPAIQKILRDAVIDVLTRLSDQTSALYAE